MCGYVKQEAPKKQHCSREGPKNEGRHRLVLLHKQAHAKGSIAESVRAAGLNVCEVGVFSKELSNMPTPVFEKPLKFITHGHIFVVYEI